MKTLSAFSLYLYVYGTDAKRVDTCTLAQLCSFAHLLHWYLVYLDRGMKLIVIASSPNNSHFYFFFSQSFHTRLHQQQTDIRLTTCCFLLIVDNCAEESIHTSRWNNNNWYLSFCLFWLLLVQTRKRFIKTYIYIYIKEKQQSNIYD